MSYNRHSKLIFLILIFLLITSNCISSKETIQFNAENTPKFEKATTVTLIDKNTLIIETKYSFIVLPDEEGLDFPSDMIESWIPIKNSNGTLIDESGLEKELVCKEVYDKDSYFKGIQYSEEIKNLNLSEKYTLYYSYEIDTSDFFVEGLIDFQLGIFFPKISREEFYNFYLNICSMLDDWCPLHPFDDFLLEEKENCECVNSSKVIEYGTKISGKNVIEAKNVVILGRRIQFQKKALFEVIQCDIISKIDQNEKLTREMTYKAKLPNYPIRFSYRLYGKIEKRDIISLEVYDEKNQLIELEEWDTEEELEEKKGDESGWLLKTLEDKSWIIFIINDPEAYKFKIVSSFEVPKNSHYTYIDPFTYKIRYVPPHDHCNPEVKIYLCFVISNIYFLYEDKIEKGPHVGDPVIKGPEEGYPGTQIIFDLESKDGPFEPIFITFAKNEKKQLDLAKNVVKVMGIIFTIFLLYFLVILFLIFGVIKEFKTSDLKLREKPIYSLKLGREIIKLEIIKKDILFLIYNKKMLGSFKKFIFALLIPFAITLYFNLYMEISLKDLVRYLNLIKLLILFSITYFVYYILKSNLSKMRDKERIRRKKKRA